MKNIRMMIVAVPVRSNHPPRKVVTNPMAITTPGTRYGTIIKTSIAPDTAVSRRTIR